MSYFYVRTIPPLVQSKKIVLTMEELVDYVKFIEAETNKFRDQLWDEELEEWKISRVVAPDEMSFCVSITRANNLKYRKHFKLFKEAAMTPPFDRKIMYTLMKEQQNQISEENERFRVL
jgi:hypothetical protein